MKPMFVAVLVSLAAALFPAAPLAAAPRACPKLAPAPPGGKPHGRGTLVAKGASAVLLCRYAGLDAATPRRLVRERLVTSDAQVARLTAAFDALRVLPPGIRSCPLDDGSEIVAAFRFRSGGDDVVRVGLSGCRVVGNGLVAARTASGGAGPRLLAQLAELVP
jgi:hypothetical protein